MESSTRTEALITHGNADGFFLCFDCNILKQRISNSYFKSCAAYCLIRYNGLLYIHYLKIANTTDPLHFEIIEPFYPNILDVDDRGKISVKVKYFLRDESYQDSRSPKMLNTTNSKKIMIPS